MSMEHYEAAEDPALTADTMIREGQVLTGPLFSEPMRVVTVGSNGPGLWVADPLPHQLEAVYDHLLKLPSVRFLAFQWQRELKEKFDERFLVLKGSDIRDQFGVNQWMEQKQIITSLDLAKRTEILPGLQQVRWDLVIVDEAHRMSARDETHKSQRYRLGELLRDNADHLLLLTATPHKGDPQNFTLFLQLLDRDAYADVKSIRGAMEQRASSNGSAPAPRPRATTQGRAPSVFLMSLYQRRLASSTYALRRSLENRARRLEEGLERAQEMVRTAPPDLPALEELEELEDAERERLERMLEAVRGERRRDLRKPGETGSSPGDHAGGGVLRPSRPAVAALHRVQGHARPPPGAPEGLGLSHRLHPRRHAAGLTGRTRKPALYRATVPRRGDSGPGGHRGQTGPDATMNKSALVELIRNGENSGVEFKRDDLRPERLATEIAALLNLEGGRILLGVEDNGSVAGLTREPRRNG